MQVEVRHAPPEQRVPLSEVVVDVETGEHPGDAFARLVQGQQLGHRVAEGLVTVVGGAERDLRLGVLQYASGDRVPLGLVGI